MAHVGEKLAFGTIRRFGGFFGLGQCGLRSLAFGDVLQQGDEKLNRTIWIAYTAGRHSSPNDVSALVQEAFFQRIGINFARKHATKLDFVGGKVVGMGQCGPGQVGKLLG